MAYQTYILVQWVEVVDGQLSPVRRFVCPTEDDKPSSGLKAGDEATVLSPAAKYTCYNGTSWTSEGGGGQHTHPESDITNLVSDLAGKMATSAFSGLSKISVGTGQPSNPATGDIWVDCN